MVKIVKYLKWFWILIISILAMGYIFDKYKPMDEELKNKEIFNKIKKIHGFHYYTLKSCEKNGKYILERPNIKNTSIDCFNGECDIKIQFKNKIPKMVDIYLEKEGICKLEEIKTKKNIKTIWYEVNLKLSQEEKDRLGIKYGDEVLLANAIENRISPMEKIFLYGKYRNKDSIIVNGKIKGIINLSIEE